MAPLQTTARNFRERWDKQNLQETVNTVTDSLLHFSVKVQHIFRNVKKVIEYLDHQPSVNAGNYTTFDES